MIPSVIPAVTDALVGLSEAAVEPLGFVVFDGVGLGEDPSDFVVVGIPDPTSSNLSTAATVEQDWATLGISPATSPALWTASPTPWTAIVTRRQRVTAFFAAVAAIGAAVLSDLTLGGVPGLLWSGVRITHYDQSQSDFGAEAQISFQLGFRARI